MNNQNPTTDNDLQKAIDDITKNTNTDPVFSDPVAAPSSVPEGDTGELDEAIGPFPAPEPVAPAPEPNLPLPEPPMPTPEAQFTEAPLPEPIMPQPQEAAPTTSFDPGIATPLPEPTPEPVPEPIIAPAPNLPEPTFEMPSTTRPLGMQQVKEAALRDLIPLLDHLNMNPSQKFSLYRNIFEDLRDYTVLEPAYRAASEISNDQERAEALLYLVESIDKM